MGDPKEPQPNSPVVLVPVSADDVARQRRRIRIAILIPALFVLAVAGLVYKRSVDPINAQQSYDAGVRLMTAARYPQAILAFQRAVKLQPNFADAYLMRGRAYVAEARPDRAIPEFTNVIELRPKDPRALLDRGQAYLDMKDYQSAIADTNQAIALDPQLSPAYNLRGVVVRATGDPRKALVDLTHAIELAPNEDNYFQRAITYQLLGEDKLAIADFDQVITRRPDAAAAYFGRAKSRRAIGDLRLAKIDHDTGRRIDAR